MYFRSFSYWLACSIAAAIAGVLLSPLCNNPWVVQDAGGCKAKLIQDYDVRHGYNFVFKPWQDAEWGFWSQKKEWQVLCSSPSLWPHLGPTHNMPTRCVGGRQPGRQADPPVHPLRGGQVDAVDRATAGRAGGGSHPVAVQPRRGDVRGAHPVRETGAPGARDGGIFSYPPPIRPATKTNAPLGGGRWSTRTMSS